MHFIVFARLLISFTPFRNCLPSLYKCINPIQKKLFQTQDWFLFRRWNIQKYQNKFNRAVINDLAVMNPKFLSDCKQFV